MKNVFEQHPITDDQKERAEKVREVFKILEVSLKPLMKQGRYTSLAWTKLEEASMFTIKGICFED